MKTFSTFFALSAAVAAFAQNTSVPTINSPVAVQCQPAQLLFSGGTPPYFLSVLPAGQVAALPLQYLPDQNTTGNYTWIVDLPAETNFTLSIRDSAGLLNYGAPTVVLASPNATCVNATVAAAAVSEGALSSLPAGIPSATPSAVVRRTVKLF